MPGADSSTRFERMRCGSRHSVLTPQSSVEECRMRLATARSRQIAQELARSWRRSGLLAQLAMANTIALCLALLCAAVASFSLASLAAFHSGLRAVITARGVPAGAAGYVNTVAAYTNWYARQPAFGGAGAPPPTPAGQQAAAPAPA